MNTSDPDEIYSLAEQTAEKAFKFYVNGSLKEAIGCMKDTVKYLTQVRYMVGPVPDLEFELGYVRAELNYYRANHLLRQDRYFLGKREAQIGLRTLNALGQAPNKHAWQKVKIRKQNFVELINTGLNSLEDETNTTYIDLLNQRDMAAMMDNETRVKILSVHINKIKQMIKRDSK